MLKNMPGDNTHYLATGASTGRPVRPLPLGFRILGEAAPIRTSTGRSPNRSSSCRARFGSSTAAAGVDATEGDFLYVPQGGIHAFRNESRTGGVDAAAVHSRARHARSTSRRSRRWRRASARHSPPTNGQHVHDPPRHLLGSMADDPGRSSRWSLWSEDSFLSIASRGSVLSIGSIGSVLSIASIGSALSLGSIGSVLSHASVMSAGSNAVADVLPRPPSRHDLPRRRALTRGSRPGPQSGAGTAATHDPPLGKVTGAHPVTSGFASSRRSAPLRLTGGAGRCRSSNSPMSDQLVPRSVSAARGRWLPTGRRAVSDVVVMAAS